MNAVEQICPCGARDYTLFLDGEYNRVGYSGYKFKVFRCKRCGLARTDPMPDVAQYASEEYAESDKPFAQGTTDAWSDSIGGYIAKLSRPGKMLDIGSHTGNLHPALVARGYEVIGVDIDPDAVAIARGAGRNVVETDLFDAGFADASFDVVTMIHTLEHLEDPNAVIREITRLLKPEGLLFINVPNYRGMLPRLMKDHWLGWVAPQHVWQFEPRTLAALVQRNGPYETVFLRGVGSLEPPSIGLKGTLKRVVATFGDKTGNGDQVVAAFRRTDGGKRA